MKDPAPLAPRELGASLRAGPAAGPVPLARFVPTGGWAGWTGSLR